MRKPVKVIRKKSITAAFLTEQLGQLPDGTGHFSILYEGHAAERLISDPVFHRPGLVLAGFTELFTHGRVQVLGNTECRYLSHFSDAERKQAFSHLIAFPIPCIILTDGNALDEGLMELAIESGVPVYQTSLPTARFTLILHDFLADQFAEQLTVHGSLVDVYGIGLLLTGRSGIGKSEVALDLIERGHRLVADDVVVTTKRDEGVLIGSGTHLVQHFMEIRGLGLVDIKAMFGVRAIRHRKRIEVIVDLQEWEPDKEYTRLGMIDGTRDIMGVSIPLVKLPIIPGKNMTVLCEVIAMNHLLRAYGYDAAEVFTKRLGEHIRNKSDGVQRGTENFWRDYE